jgi:hypothetical protein
MTFRISRHAFASLRLFSFQRSESLATLNSLPLLRSKLLRVTQSVTAVRSVERKGIEPLTPGLQSRCSPS